MRALTFIMLGHALLTGCGDKSDTGTATPETSPPDTGEDTVVDADGDGVSAEEDCDDADPEVSPLTEEICDDKDNNCDGAVDEGFDADADGYTTCGGDCDDSDADISPDAAEVCDEADNNCDGEVDEGLLTAAFEDLDGDGYGSPDTVKKVCALGDGEVDNGDDCDDDDSATFPGAAPGDSKTACMTDSDGDGYGDDAPGPDVTPGTDCDDAFDTAYPGAVEECDGLDNDCDGVKEAYASYSTDFDDKAKDWTFNGYASQVFNGADGFLLLTEASGGQYSTAFLTTPITASQFTALFTIEIGGGTGADGMSFLFLGESDPAVITDCSGGSCLGSYGLSGFGVEFDTYSSSGYGDPNDNHISVTKTDDFSIYASDTTIPTLSDNGAFDVAVYFDSGDIDVYFDGKLSISTTIKDYDLTDILFGFSAATGGLYDAHVVTAFELQACQD